jgi:hypothetical protein
MHCGLSHTFGDPRAAAGAGRNDTAFERIARSASLVADETGPAIVEPSGEVTLPQLVGLERVTVHVDDQMIDDSACNHAVASPVVLTT